ncbi:MAG TPA: hypothetical protein VM287_14430 [Egibacteraceae bacterium]|nr:hypothetical protein [Egibacteraceae bacterium]
MDRFLALAVELALARGTRMVEPVALEEAAAADGIDHDGCVALLRALRDGGLLQLALSPSRQVVLVALTDAGVLRWAEEARPDLVGVRSRLAAAAAAAVGQGPVDLAATVGEPPLLVECVLDQWVRERRVVYSKAPGRRFRVHRVS